MEPWLRWLFGVACPGCGIGLPVGRVGPFCELCAVTVQAAGPPWRLDLPGGGVPIVGRWRYCGGLAAAVQRIKFVGAQPSLRGLTGGMDERLRGLAGPGRLTLVAVAPQERRLRQRGFHLPDRLAAALAAGDSQLVVDGGLRRLDLHPPRSLRPELLPVFVASPSRRRQPVWLIDDVVTTGLTLRRVAAALALAGRPVAGAICLCDARTRPAID